MQIQHSPLQEHSASTAEQSYPIATQRHILEEIVWSKLREVELRRSQIAFAEVQRQASTSSSPHNFLNALRQSPSQPSLIAEVKKASPSKGILCADFDPVEIAKAYERGGATCLSVLTDQKFFQGSFTNLRQIREQIALPLLCKEFVIDPYQIYLARVNGADAVLLIAAILSDRILQSFLDLIHTLGMTALVEVHTIAELDRVMALSNVKLIGINNRNLEDFSLDLTTTRSLLTERRVVLDRLDITIVSESGLYTPQDLAFVADAGANAVLVGESLVKQPDVEQAVRDLLQTPDR
ncbi:MAG: indole-3-glycerol phosphate synthase TrpC [Myxacorys chilensis ATA2-1-KO14]|nr:indole-3-glycerol phosphate synthase TrpC [Myxacorys chilensis ATA2-1-KO14]